MKASVSNSNLLKYLLPFALLSLWALQGMGQVRSMKIACVDPDSVLYALPEYPTQAKAYESYATELTDKVKSLEQEVQERYAKLLESFNSMSQDAINQEQAAIQQLRNSLEKERKEVRRSLMQRERMLMQPLLQKVEIGIQNVAKEQGYAGVVRKNTLRYTNPEYDITNDVIRKLGGTP